jgi:predicted hydrocarbon binding protein
MGGAKMGKRVGEKLINSDIGDNEAVERFLHFLKHCKVGKVSMDETIKIKDSCESAWTRFYNTTWKEPCCFFTTGFFNGFFYAVKNQHVKETKCIAIGDPYCEWEFK